MGATPFRWSEVPEDNPVPHLYRRLLRGENALVAKIELEKGCVVKTHHHASEQIAIILSGKVRWNIGLEGSANYHEIEMTGGEVLLLPPNVPHGLVVIEDAEVFDVLSPVGPMGVDQKQ